MAVSRRCVCAHGTRARARALTRHLQFTGFQYKKKIKVDSDTRMELVRSKLKHVDAATVHCADDVTAALIADGVHELVQTGTKGYYWDAQKKKWKIKVGVRALHHHSCAEALTMGAAAVETHGDYVWSAVERGVGR